MKIFADPERLEHTAASMEQQTDEYERLYHQLYAVVDQMQEAWKGKDNLVYTEQIRSFSADFMNMSNLMRDYIAFLRSSAELYRSTQHELVQRAKLLKE